MTTRFLAGEQILSSIRAANAEHAVRRLGVAYWGGEAVERLALDGDLSQTRVICDLWSDGCDAGSISDLLKRGASIRTVEAFHAKMYLYPDRVVIGSANASRGGLGDIEEPPARAETAVLCDEPDVLSEAAAWFEIEWKKGVPVDAAMVAAARTDLAAIQKARRPSLLQALAQEPNLFKDLDLWIALRTGSEASDEADLTWEAVKGEYSADDRVTYGDGLPFYEVEAHEVSDCEDGRIFLDFERAKKGGRPGFEGIWKIRADGLRPIADTTRSLALLDQLPSLCGRRALARDMKSLGTALTPLDDGDFRIGEPKIRKAISGAWKASAP